MLLRLRSVEASQYGREKAEKDSGRCGLKLSSCYVREVE